MSTVSVLLFAILFSSALSASESKGLCEVDSLSDYLTNYLSLPYSCDEIYITNRTEVLTSSKLRKATDQISSIKIVGGISGIQKNCFKYNSGVGNITIVGNNLPTLSSSTFSGLSLKELNLTNNNIVDLGLNPFGDSKISKLDLSYNKISTLLKSSFTSQLLDIRISNNRLSYIEPECFKSDIQFLSLEYNLLYYINQDHFSNLRNLKELYLSNNRIVEVAFTDNNLNKLEILDLSYNQIKNLNRIAFSSLFNLRYFNLTSNKITWMSPTTLQIFGNLKVLDMSLNYLNYFPYSSLPQSVEKFNAFGNPWHCECFLHMEKYLVYNKVIFNCGFVRNHVPFCISYGGRCSNMAKNDTLIAIFMESISGKVIPYCDEPRLPRGEVEPLYPIAPHRPFLAPIRRHQFK